jgi:uncharacterized membrane protein
VSKSRFEAFSDGVFSFAVTLLILGIVLPQMRAPSENDLTTALLRLWPNVLAYALSFAVIGIMWQNHHALFRKVANIDRRTVFINLMLLGATVFVPFATTTLGMYPSMRTSTFLYGLVLTTIAILFNLLLKHLIDAHAFVQDVTADVIKPTVVAYRFGLIGYVCAMFLALASPAASFIAYLGIAAYYLIPRGLDADIRQ